VNRATRAQPSSSSKAQPTSASTTAEAGAPRALKSAIYEDT
jgi:hypothetical protein